MFQSTVEYDIVAFQIYSYKLSSDASQKTILYFNFVRLKDLGAFKKQCLLSIDIYLQGYLRKRK